MSDVFHRQTRIDPPVAVRGEGLYIVDAQGRRYLDASGGAAVSCVGHGHPAVVAAIREQAEALAYSHTSFFTSRPAEELGARLVADSPAGLSRAYFTSGGSKRALHAAVKREAMARGLLVYPMGGTIDGERGDHVLLAPPFTVAESDLATITERLGEAVDAAIAAAP
ncbi:MAG: aminotransferase class III-fold pyridoxal phosphate-dependent enzyme [Candidatus Rokuibacteriota bacterium]